MFGLFKNTVAVALVDDTTGKRFVETAVPLAQLPETFEVSTEVELGGQQYFVVGAEPKTKAEFSRSKRLVVRVRKVEHVDPNQLLFSLPSICGSALPQACAAAPGTNPLTLHEDDWRQCEFVSQTHASSVAAELADIRRIHSESAVGVGWRHVHVRERIAAPLSQTITWSEITEHLGAFAPIDGVSFAQEMNVCSSVGATLANEVVLWGVETQWGLETLCVEHVEQASPETVAVLKRLADDMGLFLVNWCPCQVYSPGGGSVSGSIGLPWSMRD